METEKSIRKGVLIDFFIGTPLFAIVLVSGLSLGFGLCGASKIVVFYIAASCSVILFLSNLFSLTIRYKRAKERENTSSIEIRNNQLVITSLWERSNRANIFPIDKVKSLELRANTLRVNMKRMLSEEIPFRYCPIEELKQAVLETGNELNVPVKIRKSGYSF